MLLTIIFDFRVIKLRNYHKISHLGHVNEILMQNPVCAMWRLIRVEQKIVWLYKQLVYCPDHNVMTISQQWCDCTRPWSEGREGGHLAVPGIVCVLPLYCLCILLRMAHSTRRPPAAAGRMKKGGNTLMGNLHFTSPFTMPLVLCWVYRLQWILGWVLMFWSGWAPASCVQLQRQWQSCTC